VYINVPQHVDIDVRQLFFSEHSTIDVPFCDDLVYLSPCEDNGNAMLSSEIVFNLDLEDLIFSVSNPTESYTNNPVPEFPVACTIAVPFETRNNFPFISGRICDLSVYFFGDTGVAITTISLALFKRLSSLTNKTSTEFINVAVYSNN
jgi:hypothetical protein